MTNTKMFVHYNGTKAAFIADAGNLPQKYTNSIVFIKGDANGAGSCIYTHGSYFANFAEFLAAINYVKGVKVGNSEYNAAQGGGYIPFAADGTATVALSVDNGTITVGLTEAFVNRVGALETNLGASTDVANAEGSAFARIANLAALVGELTGGETTSIAGQIDALRQEIKGTLAGDDATTLETINDELDALAAKWSDLSNEVSDNAGVKVNVTVKTKDGKVSDVLVDETQLDAALNLKANSADVYTKTEAESMAQGKVDALANGAVKANTDAIATLKGNTSVEGSVDKKIQDAINAFEQKVTDNATIDTLKELVDYVAGVDGGDKLATAIADIAANKAAIETLKGDDETAGSVAKAIADEVARAEAAYAVKGTEGVASGAAARAEEAYGLAEQKVDAAGAKAQAQAAISEIAEVTKEDADNAYVKVSVTTKEGSVSSVVVDDAGVKTYADQVAETAKSEAISATTESLKSYYTKTEVDAMWSWEEL